jgi:hypothetical protein
MTRIGMSGESRVAEMKAQLDSLGPRGLWYEVCRIFLEDHSIVQSGSESFAETIGAALIERFRSRDRLPIM